MPRGLMEIKITATGTVRDAGGNVKDSFPIEQTMTVTEDELRAMQEGREV